MSTPLSFEADINIPEQLKQNPSSYAMNKFLHEYHNQFNITQITSGGCIHDGKNRMYMPLYVSYSK